MGVESLQMLVGIQFPLLAGIDFTVPWGMFEFESLLNNLALHYLRMDPWECLNPICSATEDCSNMRGVMGYSLFHIRKALTVLQKQNRPQVLSLALRATNTLNDHSNVSKTSVFLSPVVVRAEKGSMQSLV